MKSRIPHVVVAVLAASAVPLAVAQDVSPAPDFGPSAVTQPVIPEFGPKAPEAAAALLPNQVPEPVASASVAEGADAAVIAAVVQELAQDPSLKGAKITVQSDDGLIVLTGASASSAQAKRAAEIATAHAGEGKVVNAIQADDV